MIFKAAQITKIRKYAPLVPTGICQQIREKLLK
jgi:hypothetical protein